MSGSRPHLARFEWLCGSLIPWDPFYLPTKPTHEKSPHFSPANRSILRDYYFNYGRSKTHEIFHIYFPSDSSILLLPLPPHTPPFPLSRTNYKSPSLPNLVRFQIFTKLLRFHQIKEISKLRRFQLVRDKPAYGDSKLKQIYIIVDIWE